MKIFKCTKCGKTLDGFKPAACDCGCITPIINGVYQFTDDAPISVDGDGLKWLGYEMVGKNYEPGYFYNQKDNKIGSSDYLADYIGRDKILLDIGTGLAPAAISFALSGVKAIAADISQVMLELGVKRAVENEVNDDNIIFTRMNGYKLELADNSVDAIIAIDVLHQLNHPELMMDEILRVLKPDGYFVRYGGIQNLGYTDEQNEVNIKYNEAQSDIDKFYSNLISEAGYSEPPFSSWEKADECVDENFVEYKTIESTGHYNNSNVREWQLKIGLHKTKTKASGSKQLIPDEIHNEAWAKTDEYAKNKYGENYEEMTRYYHYTVNMKLYKIRDK